MRVFRKRAKLTQKEIAELVGVSQARISYIESEVEEAPPMSLMIQIASAIGFEDDPMRLQDTFTPEVKRA